MVLDAKRGIFYRLNATATPLWTAMESGDDAGAAIVKATEVICAKHSRDSDDVRHDLKILLADLLRHGLVEETQ